MQSAYRKKLHGDEDQACEYVRRDGREHAGRGAGAGPRGAQSGPQALVDDVLVIDEETRSSTYPDFDPFCGEAGGCGNTCCVPSDEWDGARAAAGD